MYYLLATHCLFALPSSYAFHHLVSQQNLVNGGHSFVILGWGCLQACTKFCKTQSKKMYNCSPHKTIRQICNKLCKDESLYNPQLLQTVLLKHQVPKKANFHLQISERFFVSIPPLLIWQTFLESKPFHLLLSWGDACSAAVWAVPIETNKPATRQRTEAVVHHQKY